MAKGKRPVAAGPGASANDKSVTLKDMLNPEMVAKLKSQADQMKAEEAVKREESRKASEEARKAEQKRLENDFEYLLNNSKMDYKNYK